MKRPTGLTTGYKSDVMWDCDRTQYWVPGADYAFTAIADGNAKVEKDGEVVAENSVTVDSDFGMPTAINYNVNTQADVLLATAAVKGTNVTVTYAEPVAFTFNHLLSKAQFTFTNAFAEESGVELSVSNITIVNAPQEGVYTIGDSIDKTNWEVNSDDVNKGDLIFGGAAATMPAGYKANETDTPCTGSTTSEARLLIPGEYTFNITFTVSHNKGGTPTNMGASVTVTLLPGNSYNFVAELNSGNVSGVVPITFRITRDDNWGTTDQPVGPVGPVYPITNGGN